MGNEGMMTIRPDIKVFLAQMERDARRTLNCPAEVGELLQIVVQTGLSDDFDELIFQAKFLVRSREVMSRIGSGADGFEKLSTEFQSSMKKSVDALKNLIRRAPEDVAQKFNESFLARNTKSLENLMDLFSDLQSVKNLQNDGIALPYEDPGTHSRTLSEKETKEGRKELLPRMQKSAGLAAVLFLFLVLLDPPVTTLGWILSLGIMGLLTYIVLQAYLLTRHSKS
jgi:hypothetical protein